MRLLFSFIFLCITLTLWLVLSLPSVKSLKHVQLQSPLKVLSHDHKLIATFGEKQRIPLPIDAIPLKLQQAFLSAEDQRFYHHIGVDFLGITRAITALIAKKGQITQGASTITMQVARNFYLNNKKTYGRKLKEIILALKIEYYLSKKEILSLYLNKIYLGQRAYGVAAASQIYYGKPLDALSPAQMAMLAGLPKAPSANNPVVNPQRALKRRNYVLARMEKLGYLTELEYQKASKQPITAFYHGPKIEVNAPYIAEMARSAMIKMFGKDAYLKGYSVTTTIESQPQRSANLALINGIIHYSERHGYLGPVLRQVTENDWPNQQRQLPHPHGMKLALVQEVQPQSLTASLATSPNTPTTNNTITVPWEGLKWARKRLPSGYLGPKINRIDTTLKPGDVILVRKQGKRWQLTQIPEVQGALVALNPDSGAILALTGGFHYGLSAYNRVIQAERQPGSAFKPFIYAAALANNMTLASIINDSPIVIDTQSQPTWRPRNSSRAFHGPTRLREGLIQSRNLVSIRLLQTLGIDNTVSFLRHFGFSDHALPQSLSLALGSGSTTPLEITRGYAAFANGGYLIMPHFIASITDDQEKVIYKALPQQACHNCPHAAPQILSPETSYLMNHALLDVISKGTGRQARILKRKDLAGKTGTTNDKIDGWFAGFNRDIVATAWMGFDAPKSLHEYGAQTALPIWIDFMRLALKNKPNHIQKRPTAIVTRRINRQTGIATKHTDANSIFELFSLKG